MNERSRTIQRDPLLRRLLGSWDALSGMPTVTGTDRVPERLEPFHQLWDRRKSANGTDGVHFFTEDYRFQRIWAHPERYLEQLRPYILVAPDFSTFIDDPLPVQIWNVYRSRLIAQFWEREAIDVLPLVRWTDQRSWSYCFEGLPEAGTLCVSTLGMARDPYLWRIWRYGYVEMIDRLCPQLVLIYGDRVLPPSLVDLAPIREYRPAALERTRHAPHSEDVAQMRLVPAHGRG